jgi:superfamily I DNA and/or RNA helicase
VALITCAHEGLHRDRSIYATDDVNCAETWRTIEILMQVVREWKASRHNEKESVIIITPYRDQKERLQEAVDRCANLWRHWVDVTTSTIDSSQGREADITIVSMVRTKGIGFMAENKARRLVALSRARDYLFVLAVRKVFAEDSWWKCLYEKALTVDVEAVLVRDDTYSDEAETKLQVQRRLRELCSPSRGFQRADVV